MDNRNVQKHVKNTLLQNANYGFSFESLLSNKFIIPVPHAEPSIPENSEIDNFLGQDVNATPAPPTSNSIVNENLAANKAEESVPLVVPSSSDLVSTGQPPETFFDYAAALATPLDGSTSTESSSAPPWLTSDTRHVSSTPFFNPAHFNQPPSSTLETPADFPNFAAHRSTASAVHAPLAKSPVASPSTALFAQPPTSAVAPPPAVPVAPPSAAPIPPPSAAPVPPPSAAPVPPPSAAPVPRPSAAPVAPPSAAPVAPPSTSAVGPNVSYRLGNVKRPTYAPVPGLASSSASNVSPNFIPFSTTAAPTVISSPSIDFVPTAAPAMSSFRQPSSTGPYSTPTTQNVTKTSYRGEHSLYRPVYHHWFYQREVEKNSFYSRGERDVRSVWKPFTMSDSLALESAFSLPTLNEETVVATDGGRYDVNVVKREKTAVYWEEERKSVVRRCSWFSKGPADSYFIPYEENIAAKLEEEYKAGLETGEWNRKLDLGNEEVVMHHSSLITHQVKSASVTIEVAADSSIPSPLKPKVVKRGGFDDFDIDDGEPEKVDHLMFLVHGIGQFCDLKFRNVIEVVDEFRAISLQLTQSHFQESCELGEANRIEILPVSWHNALHGDDIDRRLKNITLPSVPRMRDFANDTILDLLFYTSPVFCQVIVNAVANEMNRLYSLFLKRNPHFKGKVSVGGHSLGSVILFDLLSNQPTTPEPEPNITDNLADEFDERIETATRRVSMINLNKSGTGQPLIKYPRVHFDPRFFFAFGSPIAVFVATRSNEILGEDFRIPTCKGFFNIFHPYDPIAYRVEPLIIPSLSNVKPVQIAHHKGRKRMHLELKDTVSHVGQRLIDTMKNTWNMVYHLAVNKSVDAAESVIQQEITQVLQSSEALANKPLNSNLVPAEPVNETTNLKVGCLNEGKRIDFVLQEAPVEYFNEYLFALASHLCYWTSRDTILFVLREIYSDMGIFTDNQLPQIILPFDITEGQTPGNPSREPTPVSSASSPLKQNVSSNPPPISGFVKK